jgi:hypothetical protein
MELNLPVPGICSPKLMHAIDDALDEVRGKLIGVLKVRNERSVGELAILPEDEFPRR